MAGYAKLKDEFAALGVKVFAASVDPEDVSKPVADEFKFPLGYGVTRAQAEQLGAWWEERRQIIQPTQFVLNAEGKVMTSTYTDGPLGRIDAADVIRLATFYEAQAKK